MHCRQVIEHQRIRKCGNCGSRYNSRSTTTVSVLCVCNGYHPISPSCIVCPRRHSMSSSASKSFPWAFGSRFSPGEYVSGAGGRWRVVSCSGKGIRVLHSKPISSKKIVSYNKLLKNIYLPYLALSLCVGWVVD